MTQATYKSFFQSTQAELTQTGFKAKEQSGLKSITYEDIIHLFDSRTSSAVQSKTSSQSMDIELPSKRKIENERSFQTEEYHQSNSREKGCFFQDLRESDYTFLHQQSTHPQTEGQVDCDLFDFIEDDEGPGLDQEFSNPHLVQGNEQEDEEDIDLIFPELSDDDPRFQYPSFTKRPKPKALQLSHFDFLHQERNPTLQHQKQQLCSNPQPVYLPPSNSFGISQHSNQLNFPPPNSNHNSLLNQFAPFNFPSLIPQAPPNPLQQFPSLHPKPLHIESNAAYQAAFKFRQNQGDIIIPRDTNLETAIHKLFTFFRHMFHTISSVKQLHQAIGHLLVSFKFTKDEVKQCIGVDKSSLHLRAGRRFLAACLAKIILAINVSRSERKGEVWRIIASCC